MDIKNKIKRYFSDKNPKYGIPIHIWSKFFVFQNVLVIYEENTSTVCSNGRFLNNSKDLDIRCKLHITSNKELGCL